MALRRKKNKVEAMVAGDKIAYGLLKSFLLPVLTLLFRPKVSGLRFVPATGPVIIASNHLSFSDSIFMPLVIPRKVTFLAKSEYFTSPGLKGLAKKLTFIALGQVSVDRAGGSRSEAALLTGLSVLAEGGCLGIYPEGTRSMYFPTPDKSNDPEELRKATDSLMKKLQELSGHEYVDIYASQAKEALDEQRRRERKESQE